MSEGKVLLPVDPRSFFCEIQSPVDAQAILEAVTIDDRPGPTELRLRLEKWMQGAAYQQVMATTQGPVSLPASVPGLSAPSKEALGDMPPPGAGRGQAPVVKGTWGPGHGERPPGV